MTDSVYRAWIQTLPSALDGRSFSEYLEHLGEWRNPACHVRRAGESGTGYKAEFVCVPITHRQHSVQHNEGELACIIKFCADHAFVRRLRDEGKRDMRKAELMAKDWFFEQREKYYRRWLKETPEGRRWAQKQEIEVTA